MLLVVVTEPGIVELRWTWLPTFIGLDGHLKQEMETKLGPMVVGKELTNATLEVVHEAVLDFICERYSAMVGLRDYLESLKFVEEPR